MHERTHELDQETELPADDLSSAEKLQEAAATIRAQMSRVIVGQDVVIEQLLLSLFTGGHEPSFI